ncbi:hypothetical protein [Shewanella sp.]|uniref:hypothetical protein n=1 Tax=Shewanella sp. TaxID=50422 RepID=UPI0040542340
MRKEFKFTVKEHEIKVTNSWFHGMKLYVGGELRDFDKSLTANGKIALLSAKLGECGVLEIYPSSLFTIEVDAYLIKGSENMHVFSSNKRLSLKEQRLAKDI